MNYSRHILGALLLAAVATTASAQGKTRDQVKAELAMAIRDGDVLAPGDSGLTEYQLHPQFYAHQRAIDEATALARQNDSQMGAAAR
jgi:hypothetical protein